MAPAKRAKAMWVYGFPPEDILARLTKRQMDELHRYVGSVADKVYRTAFDNGHNHALDLAKDAVIAIRRAL